MVNLCLKLQKLPVFDDVHDKMDSFLHRFERYAGAQNWGEENWAINLSALLRGKALDVYALMLKTDALNYQSLKTALLRRLNRRTMGLRKSLDLVDLNVKHLHIFGESSYFDRWLEKAKVPRSFEGCL